jgi:hypothetical protein
MFNVLRGAYVWSFRGWAGETHILGKSLGPDGIGLASGQVLAGLCESEETSL